LKFRPWAARQIVSTGASMRAIKKVQPGTGFKVGAAPVPPVGPGEVLLELKAASLCGTDLHIHAWDEWAASYVEPPLIVGHECCCVVVVVGEGVKGLEVGALAAVEGHFFCEHCLMCQTERRHLCLNMKLFGVTIDGGFAEYVRVPARNVWKLPPGTPPSLGALMDPFGNAVHAVFAGGDVTGQTVAVTGCGPIGLMAVALCRASGAAHILATDVSVYRLELARKMGADTVVNVSKSDPTATIGGEELDALLEFSGHPKAINQGLDMLRPGGRAALLGLPAGAVELNLAEQVILKGISLHGVFGRRIFETWYRATNLLQKVDLDSVVTHSFALVDIDQALALMRSGECGKVVLSP
jgi:threonine 3-dehydrogenase